MSRRGQLLLLGVLLLLLALVSVRSVRRVKRQGAAWEVCEAMLDGRMEEAAGSSLSGFDPPALRALECRCQAQLALGAVDRCFAELEAVLADDRHGDWMPSPDLSAIVARQRMQAGRTDAAEDLVRRGRTRDPDSRALRQLDFELLRERRGEGTALDQMEREWVESGRPAGEWSVFLGVRRLNRREWGRAAELLGEEPPPGAPPDGWYSLKGMALAGAGRGDDLTRLFDSWYAAGGDSAVILARYATLISAFGLLDRDASPLDLLLRAAAQADRIEDRELEKLLYHRLIAQLAVEGYPGEATAWLDRAHDEGFEFDNLLPEVLASSGPRAELGEGSVARVRFHLPRAHRTSLALSDDGGHEADSPFLDLPITGRSIDVERTVGAHPLRWVLRDGEQRCERGSVALRPGAITEVEITATGCRPADSYEPPARRETDGRRRVVLVVLDCADWRLVRYLEARGEAPFLSWAISRGLRTVLTSDPPFTAVAVNKLIHPQGRVPSFLGLLYELGDEVAALRFVGTNPVSPLGWFLASQQDAFATLARGPRTVVDLLHASGSVGAGRATATLGPWGERHEIQVPAAERPLRDDELPFFPGLAETDAAHQQRVREMAADLDLFSEMAANPSVDYMAGRVAALDLTTHSLYPQLDGTRQELTAEAGLAAVYRYLDRRVGELYRGLDGDDVLLVISDHGIRTPLEHDQPAFFVAIGDQVPSERLDGAPELRGTARLVAELLGEDTDWPATGMEQWVGELPPAGSFGVVGEMEPRSHQVDRGSIP